jgi:hypothetical protein
MRQSLILLLMSLYTLSLSGQQNPLIDILRNNSEEFEKYLIQPEKYRIGIIYTQIDRDANNQPAFRDFSYFGFPEGYFYPASTVKFPMALLALEKLNELKIIGLNAESPLMIGYARPPQTGVTEDTSAQSGLPSIAHYIKKIMLVSDNDAFNRLYEFIGRCDINQKLHSKGYLGTEIIHRLALFNFNLTDNGYTNPITFFKESELLYHQGERWCEESTVIPRNEKYMGIGYIDNDGQLVDNPFPFYQKNIASLQDLHQMMKATIFPDLYQNGPYGFNLKKEDYQFLYEYMSKWPSETTFPNYKHLPDNYVKFLILGDGTYQKTNGLRIFNKIGMAYGFLTDIAYIIDTESGVEFMLSATIHVNDNQIYNDVIYEYDKEGLPFLSRLGQYIYEAEKQRKKDILPDFSNVLINQR